MAEENKNVELETASVEAEAPAVETSVADKSVTKKSDKEIKKDVKPNIFVRIGKKIAKVTKDTVGELKKVVWTPKAEVFKNFKLVIATVVVIGFGIAVVDVVSSLIINSIAGLIG